jgi:hypothetical protein
MGRAHRDCKENKTNAPFNDENKRIPKQAVMRRLLPKKEIDEKHWAPCNNQRHPTLQDVNDERLDVFVAGSCYVW